MSAICGFLGAPGDAGRAAAMDAMGRQPEAAGKIQAGMVIGCALIEALTIYALVAVFVMEGKIG